MKDDKSVLTVYHMFMNEGMSLLNLLEEGEKQILENVNLINRKKVYLKILNSYEEYYRLVQNTWAQIYSSDREFNQAINGMSTLMQGQSLCAQTEIQRLIEQFFYSLSMVLIPIILLYKGKKRKTTANQESDIAREMMHDLIKEIEKNSAMLLKSQGNPNVMSVSATANEKINSQPITVTPMVEHVKDLQKSFFSEFSEYNISIEELGLSVTALDLLKKSNVSLVSEICSADFSLNSNILSKGIVSEIFRLSLKRIRNIQKEKQLNSEEGHRIFSEKTKLNADILDILNNERIEMQQKASKVESDYQNIKIQNALFIDFNQYKELWDDIAQRLSEDLNKCNSIRKEWHALDEIDYVKNVEDMTGRLLLGVHCFSSLKTYAKCMSKIMQNLDLKTKGIIYTLEQYQDDLNEAEKLKGICSRFYKRMENLCS